MNHLIQFLKDKITDNASLGEIIDVFEQMCNIPLEEDMILFETGTFTTSRNESMFQISLVRQFPNEDEEFYQIHVDILYGSDQENKIFCGSVWEEDVDENIFEHIRNSEVFDYAKNKGYSEVRIWCDET